MVGLVAGSGWFLKNYEVHGLDQVSITRRGVAA